MFDGEGHISLVRRATKPNGRIPVAKRLAITNCDPRLLVRIAERFGGKIHTHIETRRGRRFFQWYTYDGMAEILTGMLPYLVVKADEAEIALQFLLLDQRDPKDRRRLTTSANHERERMLDKILMLRHREWTKDAVPVKYRTGD